MTDTEFLQILTLATPFAILLMVLVMIRLTRWQDEREDRRRATLQAGAARPACGVSGG